MLIQRSLDPQHTCHQNRVQGLDVLPATGQVPDQQTEHSTGMAKELLLLLSGDVESNPGPNPPSADSYREGLARLLSGAPKPVREVLVCWDQTLSQTEIIKKFDAILKPSLQEAMVWLFKVEVKEIKQNKSVLVKDLLTCIESYLPDTCGVCENEYSVERGETPTLRCEGCSQGFHEPCLVETGLSEVLPKVPGKLLWLCIECKSNFQLVTLAGNRGKPDVRRERLPSSLPPATPTEVAEEVAASETSQGTLTVDQVQETGKDCSLYLDGKCPHGISGKKNGVCIDRHPKRCHKFMRWGDKGDKGCRGGCHKLHPALCPKSLYLKCSDIQCPHPLHTLKCVRPKKDTVKDLTQKRALQPRRNNPLAPRKNSHALKSSQGGKSRTGCSCQGLVLPVTGCCIRNNSDLQPAPHTQAHHCNTRQHHHNNSPQHPISPQHHNTATHTSCSCDQARGEEVQLSSQGFPASLQHGMLEALMERLARESMERVARQLLAAPASA